MEHLTVDQIMDFVSLTALNEEATALIATVNGHIHKCEACLQRVRAFGLLHDEFVRLSITKDFRAYAKENAPQYEEFEK